MRKETELERATLDSLTKEELDHVNLGLELNFFRTIEPVPECPGLFILGDVGLSGDCTVLDAWKVAQAGADTDNLPGLTDILPQLNQPQAP